MIARSTNFHFKCSSCLLLFTRQVYSTTLLDVIMWTNSIVDRDKEMMTSGKRQKRGPITRHNSTRNHERTERIHADLCGPFPVPSLAEKIYYVVYICDYSRCASTYFLARKMSQEILDTWLQLSGSIKAHGHNTLYFWSDNGGEFSNQLMKDHLGTEGITWRGDYLGSIPTVFAT
jgi:hypothetical protein